MGVSLYLVFRNRLLRPNSKYRLSYLFTIFIVYLFLGSWLHQVINSPPDQIYQKEIFQYLKNFYDTHECLSEPDLNDFIELVLNASANGVAFAKDTTQLTPSWVFGGETLFFVFTLLSTIGYGHLAPVTQTGKIFCIFYLLLGVPITVILLNSVVERLEIYVNPDDLNYPLSRSEQAQIQLETRKRKLTIVNLKYWKFSIKKIYLKISAIGAILITFIYVIPSIIFSRYTESNWGFIDSLYYCFISISTIGFGDLVPGNEFTGSSRDLYRIIMTVYLMVGILINMLFLNIFFRLSIFSRIYHLLRPKTKYAYQYLNPNYEQNSGSEMSSEGEETQQPTTSAQAEKNHSEVAIRNLDPNVVTVEMREQEEQHISLNRSKRRSIENWANNNNGNKTKNV